MLRGRGTGASKKTCLWEGRRVGTHSLSPPSTVITQMGIGEKMVDCMCLQPSPAPYRKIYLWSFSTSSSLCSSKCMWTFQSSVLGMNCALCGIKHTQCKHKASAGVMHIWEDAPDRKRQEKRGWEPRIYPPTRYWFGEF